jgi:hypothetical protein
MALFFSPRAKDLAGCSVSRTVVPQEDSRPKPLPAAVSVGSDDSPGRRRRSTSGGKSLMNLRSSREPNSRGPTSGLKTMLRPTSRPSTCTIGNAGCIDTVRERQVAPFWTSIALEGDTDFDTVSRLSWHCSLGWSSPPAHIWKNSRHRPVAASTAAIPA